ncbi:translocase [Salipiger bermudensis HTCC2601]|uniref:Translocase n=1 Tax=Salipiger bermudensis (strain DSM 26914 / JCM 13377 / KCTC 12554 / HTCC2601) TaxID=314265 RepID=Q0FWU7_SALBH|nr:translocase [Salipiger bermudensis HTCC2601]
MIAPRVAVLHHEPGLAAKALPVDIDMAAQPRP